MHRICLRWDSSRRRILLSLRCSHRMDGHVHAVQSIQENSAQSVDSRVRQDRGPAAAEQLIQESSALNVENQDHNLRR